MGGQCVPVAGRRATPAHGGGPAKSPGARAGAAAAQSQGPSRPPRRIATAPVKRSDVADGRKKPWFCAELA
eukprot:1243597-Prymnesium_polylepis.1